jgi:single-strand DNA-binding protein
MNDTIMTVVGNVVDEPRMRITKNGHAVTNFRLASTSRRFDRDQNVYVDSGTLFVTVTCWRALGENVALSLHKGQPVVVTGRYYSREYVVNEVRKLAYELEASAVGHDLTRGTAEFTRTYRPRAATQVDVDADGVPSDASDRWLDVTPTDAVPDAAAAVPDGSLAKAS